MRLFLVALTVFLFSSGLASASESVTYSCCNNFTTSNGTIFENFDSLTGWTSFGTGTKGTDVINYIEGTGGMFLNSSLNAADPMKATKTVSWDLTTIKNFDTWVYMDNSSNTSLASFYFSADSGFTTYFYIDLPHDSYNSGWNHFTFNTTDFVSVGGMAITNPVIRFRVVNKPCTGCISNITFDNFRANVQGRPKALITFDDNSYSSYTIAKPIMDANNQRATRFIITGTADADATLQSHLQAQYTAGWDISSHTENHSVLTSLSVNQIQGELNNSQDWLDAEGYTRSSKFFAYPQGRYNSTVVEQVKSRYVFARDTDNGSLQPSIHTDDPINISYLIKVVGIDDTTDYRYVIETINRTIERNSTIVISFHNIVDTYEAGSNFVTTSNFTNISNYLALRSNDIDVITFYDYVEANVPNNTPIKGKTVNINASGLTTISSNNYLNDDTVDLFVYPSSNYVNVSVSSCSGNQVTWTEQSNVPIVSTHHVTNGCGFPSNSLVSLSIDGASPIYYMTNSTGWVTFDYNGTFSTHSFSLLSSSYGVPQSVIDNTNTMFGAVDIIAIIAIIVVLVVLGLASVAVAESGDITELLSLVLVGIVVILIVVSVTVYVLAPFLGAKI